MPERNASIVSVLEEIADLLDIQGANAFRVRAYRNAARNISDLGTEIDVLMERGTPLTEISGVGADLAQKIEAILRTGTCEFLQSLRTEVNPGITQLLKIPALGPRRVRTLYQTLHIDSLEKLLAAAQAGQIRGLPGFGEKTERRILDTVQSRMAMARRLPVVLAARHAEPLAAYLRAAAGVNRVEIAGSYRRMRATVGDIDMVAITTPGSPVMERFTAYGAVKQVLSKGPTRSSVLLEPGLQVDLRSVPAPSFGAAMVYFTGSKAHNIAIRRMGQERGLKINEYGVFREALCIGGESEESVYATIDLPWIAPELREDKGEIEAAQRHQLPELVTTADVQGELHARMATAAAAQEMLRAAQKQGLHYVALVLDARDASRFDSARAAREIDMMHRLQADASKLRVLTGIEVGIGQNGELMLSEEILQPFDVVIASAYEGWSLSYEEQTQRLLTAMATQRIAILAQPAGPADAAFDFDFSAVARKATERGVGLEISLHPERMAPTETALDIAKREGARFVVSCEAAEASGLDVLRFSVGYARRAGIERHMVFNTSGMSSLEPWLQTHRMETHARQHQRYV